ncbi:MAG: hypothetical protein IJX94_01490 [Clostridia bacterium]|nr:hypothetical protein [Clostridia bacterium]
MKKNAKKMGYKVIDEFGIDIASMVYVECENNEVVRVIDEFDIDITRRVRIERAY